MTTDTGMTAVGTIVETIGAETTGAGISGGEISGAESKPAEKLSAVVIGSATTIGPCGTVTRTIAATIVASAKPRSNPGRKQSFVTGRNRAISCPSQMAVNTNVQCSANPYRRPPLLAMTANEDPIDWNGRWRISNSVVSC